MQVDFGTIEEQAPAIDLGLKLNGKDVKLPAVKIYAPTESGEAGLFLKSQGEGEAPTWEEVSTDITINGETIPTAEASIFAPTYGGEGEQILQSQGPDRAPEWRTFNPFPVGMITPFAGSEAPDGWLLCDGSEYAYIEEGGGYSKYIQLFRTIRYTYGGEGETFRVPDLRGKFLEGAGTTTGHALGDSVNAALPTPALTSGSTTPSMTFTGSSVTSGTKTPSMTFTGNKMTGSLKGGSYALFGDNHITSSGVLSSDGGKRTASGTSEQSNYGANLYFNGTPSGTITGGSHSHTVTAAGTISGGSHSHTVGLSDSNTIYGKSETVQPASVCVNYIIKY